METTKKKRGGKRPGAGRRKIPPEAARRLVTLRLERPLYEVLVSMAEQLNWKPATFMQNELRRVAKAYCRKCRRAQRPPARPWPVPGKFPAGHWKDGPVIDVPTE